MENNRICKKCGGISGWDSYFQSWVCTRCGDMIEKRITNGDKIRAMTDEELATKISGIETFALTCGGAWAPENWLKWLQQEVK